MNATFGAALDQSRVMIACTAGALRAAVAQQALQGEVEPLRIASDPDRLATDFDDFRPDVLVFAFQSLAQSQEAQRNLYRHGQSVLVQPHRTLVLCHDAEVPAAFELCRQGHFDDFVPWDEAEPDTRRLVMSVRVDNRKLALTRPATPTLGDLRAHLRHLDDLRQLLARLDKAGDGDEMLRAEWTATRPALQAALSAARELGGRLAGLRPLVLVVDDDQLARRLIERSLDPKAYELRFAGDGIDALNQLRRMRPDVILMDVRMPGLDGVSLTQRLKAQPQLAPIPVILMTGDTRRETMASSIEVGAAAFLVKPYTREALVAKLEKVLGSHDARP